ncbi:hypothetical protein MIR68_007792 [Amoeboaphelidium protococcarum]|nr:hypothetical protein MIR68_007792 [Amoeboaphelidium protococcarum]KAI3645379.1 hypothetical protein MP228_008307 [Amoeboaphelidium protococcarum]
MDEDTLIKDKLLSEEKIFKKSYKTLAGVLNSEYYKACGDPNAAQDDAFLQQKAMLKEKLTLEWCLLEQNVQKQLAMQQMLIKQTLLTQQEHQNTQKSCVSVQSDINQCKSEIERVKQVALQRQEYDTLAEDLLTLPSRDNLQAQISQVEDEVVQIQSQISSRMEMFNRKKDEIIALVSQVQQMGNQSVQDQYMNKDDNTATNDVQSTDNALILDRNER